MFSTEGNNDVKSRNQHQYPYRNRDYQRPPSSSTPNESFNESEIDYGVSESSNDVLATIDGIRLEVDNVSMLYNNAADPHNKNISANFLGKSVSNTNTITAFSLTKTRLVFLLAPAMSIEFTRTFSSLFLLLKSFISLAQYFSMLISGLLGMFIIQFVAVKFRTFKSTNLKKSTIVKFLVAYQMFLMCSLALVTVVSWNIVLYREYEDVKFGNSTAKINVLNNSVIESEGPPIISSILLLIGYLLVTSSSGNGQYVLLSFVSYGDSNVSAQTASSVVIVWTAVGGILAGFIGVMDTVSSWCLHHDCHDHVTAHTAILSSLGLCISFICALISLGAIYYDVIFRIWERIDLYRKTYFFIDPNYKVDEQQQQYNSNTAKDEFDECAPLLQASGQSFSSSNFLGHSMGSQNTLLNRDGDDSQSVTMATTTTNIKMYAHQLPVPAPTLKTMLKRKEFISVSVIILLLSSLSVTFQFFSTQYLSDAVLKYEETTSPNVSTISPDVDSSDNDAIVNPIFTDPSLAAADTSKSTALKLACAGCFVYNMVFLVAYLKRKWISSSISLAWKPWICPCVFLTFTIFAIALASTDLGAIYVFTALVFGLVRTVDAEMIHTIARQVDRSWPPADHHRTSTLQAFLWSLVPTSMAISGVLVPVLQWSSGNPHLPIAFMVTISVMLTLCFVISRVNVLR